MAALQRPAIPIPRILIRRPGRLLLYGAMVLLVAAAIFQVNRFSTLTTRGYAINDLQRDRAQRQAANHEMEADVASLSSLARVDWDARTRLKLEPASNKMYITVHGDIPQRQSLPTRFLPAKRPASTAPARDDAPVWRRALGLLPRF